MVYIYRGINVKRLKKIADAVCDRVRTDNNEITLKNGAEVAIYGESNNWLVVTEDDIEHEFNDDYEMAYFLLTID